MAMKKLRKGDQVVVLSGKDKGRTGSITRMVTGDTVLIEGVNVSKKHQRGNPQKNQPGGLLDKEMPLHVSKVAIWNAGSKKADRVGVKTLADGKRVRFLKSNNEVLDVK
jgi:large subunit ribosomal protein L24